MKDHFIEYVITILLLTEEEEEDLFTKQNMYTNDKAIMTHSQVKYI